MNEFGDPWGEEGANQEMELDKEDDVIEDLYGDG